MIDTTQPLKLAINDWGVEATIEDGTLAGQTLRGLFDEPPATPTMFDQGVESIDPLLTVPHEALPADLVAHGTHLWINDRYFVVTGVARNLGAAELTLREVDHV